MHELGIAMEIAEVATERAGKLDGNPRIAKIVVEVGKLTAVLPDALAFAWDAAIEGSTLEGCALEIVTIDGRGKCTRCGTEQAMTMVFGRCACGTTDLELIAGEELTIRHLEVQ
jgi:hydrogenase nickel incorporation protein HypA/HybF